MAPLDVAALRRSLFGGDPVLVGVDGHGGSGKSTLARRLGEEDGVVVVELDDFYLPSADRVDVPARPGENYDLDRLVKQVLDPATRGEPVRYQRYDWDGDVLGAWVDVPAGASVVVEGVYSTSARLRDRFAFRIWVETPYEVRLARGVERDGEHMRATWVEEWMPAEERYVADEDPASYAHLVVGGAGAGGGTGAEFVVLRGSLPGGPA